MMKQTLLASVVSGFLILAPVAQAEHKPGHKAEKSAKKEHCECGDCKKNNCAKKECAHCNHGDEKKADAPKE